jgi:hypothetical protein
MVKKVGLVLDGCIIDTNILIYHVTGVLTDQVEKTFADALENGSSIS